jgi:hypothetical protein
MKLKAIHYVDVVEIQVAVTDEVKKVQKRIFGRLSETVRWREILYIHPMELIMNKKNGILLSHVYSIFKNSVQKFGLHGF